MLYSVLCIAAPLLIVTLGALISEYAGRMAMFLECIINMGAFFCFAFALYTKSAVLGSMLSIFTCMLFVFVLERIASECGANMFLISLAMNLLFAAFTTFFSDRLFNTRGVLYSTDFSFDAPKARLITTIICYAIAIAEILVLKTTRTGLVMRITGSDANVLSSQGISISLYRSLSWLIAAFSGSLAGCVLAIRLSSYVPGVASGRGWTALAAVFLGRKRPIVTTLAVIVFAFSEYASTHIQNIQMLANVSPSLLLALPYIVSLLLIVFIPRGE